MADIILGVTEEEYEQAGSKFITSSVPLTAENVGHVEYRNIELGLPYEKTAGKSISFPGKIVGGVDDGKDAEIAAGINKAGVWKLKEILRAIDVPVKMVTTSGGKRPSFDPTAVAGKKCLGMYAIEEGKKGGDPDGESVYYPKLTTILPEDANPAETSGELL